MSQLDAILQTCFKEHRFPADVVMPSSPSIYETIKNITLAKEFFFELKMWQHQTDKFEYEPLYTDEGLCYTFNSINSEEIYTDG